MRSFLCKPPSFDSFEGALRNRRHSPSELKVELIKGGQSLATTVDLGVATVHGFAKKGRGQKKTMFLRRAERTGLMNGGRVIRKRKEKRSAKTTAPNFVKRSFGLTCNLRTSNRRKVTKVCFQRNVCVVRWWCEELDFESAETVIKIIKCQPCGGVVIWVHYMMKPA